MIRTADVQRSEFLFGWNRRPGETHESTFKLILSEAAVYGLAIAADSEVRGVRVRIPGHGPWFDLVEGAPMWWTQGITLTDVELQRLDYTDGRLVLAYALDPGDIPLLPRDVAKVAVVRAHNDAHATNLAHLGIHLQRPRGCDHFEPVHGGRINGAASAAIQRDRLTLVRGVRAPGSTGTDIIDTLTEFGDATDAGNVVYLSDIGTEADVVLTRPLHTGLTSFALRWGAGVAASSGGSDAVGYAQSGTYEPEWLSSTDMSLLFGLGIEGDETTLAWSRVGSGPGPQAGDVVTVLGFIYVENPELAESTTPSFALSLPSGAGGPWYPEPSMGDVRGSEGSPWLGFISPETDYVSLSAPSIAAENFAVRWIEFTYVVVEEPE